MNSNNVDLNSAEPYNGPEGYAVKFRGEVCVRSASPTTVGAKINGLVLFFGINAYHTGGATDEQINSAWATYAEAQEEEYTIVPVTCIEVQQGEVN